MRASHLTSFLLIAALLAAGCAAEKKPANQNSTADSSADPIGRDGGQTKSETTNTLGTPMTHRDHYIAKAGKKFDPSEIREDTKLAVGNWKFFDRLSKANGQIRVLSRLGVDDTGRVISNSDKSDWAAFLRDPAVTAAHAHAAYAFVTDARALTPDTMGRSPRAEYVKPPTLEKKDDGSALFSGWFGWRPSPERFPSRIDIAVTADGTATFKTTHAGEPKTDK